MNPKRISPSKQAQECHEQLTKAVRALIRRRMGTITALERHMGLSRGYIGDALNGQKPLTVPLVLALVEALGVSIEVRAPTFDARPGHPGSQRQGVELVVRIETGACEPSPGQAQNASHRAQESLEWLAERVFQAIAEARVSSFDSLRDVVASQGAPAATNDPAAALADALRLLERKGLVTHHEGATASGRAYTLTTAGYQAARDLEAQAKDSARSRATAQRLFGE